MNTLDLKKLLLGSSLLIGGFVTAVPAYAQTAQDDAVQAAQEVAVQPVDEEEEATDKKDEVIVTGSRIKRDTFSSLSPLQVITGDISREAGLMDAADILQGATASTGQQIDTTFQGFVLDNGPGSSTVDLRGLGASRTLFLMNGRRMAPAGVEGAPQSFDLNLVPSIMIDRYDVLLDGASSIYGSDAVAGVVNAILKKDFEGFEVEGFIDESEHGGGTRTLSGLYGKNWDRGFIGIGGDYSESDEVKLRDRPWTDGCDSHVEITETGEIRTIGVSDAYNLGQLEDKCKRGALAGRAYIYPQFNGQRTVGFGSVYYNPAFPNTGIGDFSEAELFGVTVDQDLDGMSDIIYGDYSLSNGARNDASLNPDFKRFSIMSFGEYTFSGSNGDITPYYEALYSKRETAAYSGAPQLFPDVLPGNAFNPCNINQPNGVDCGAAYNAVLRTPQAVDAWRDYYGVSAQEFLDFYGVNVFAPVGQSLMVEPIVSVQGDRNYVESDVAQLRLVGGIKGDIPFMDKLGLSNWTGDASVSYSKSIGHSLRTGVDEAKLNFALGQEFSSGGLVATPGPCIAGPNTSLSAAEMQGCVPVNMFAPSLYNPLVGSFATAAERDYVFSDRTFKTGYEQTIWSAYMTGDVMELPAGTLAAVVGVELRYDEIDSIPNKVASEGQLFGYFLDEGADGSKTTKEIYGELAVPIVADEPFFRQLDMNLSGRITNDEFYGSNSTYSVEGGWRPFDSLLLRASVGSSFRAPNLRELYMKNQSGFNNVFDPCTVPEGAIDLVDGYIPANDDRDQVTLDNCIAAGLDPTTFNQGGSGYYNVEIERYGALYDPGAGLDGLQPETSLAQNYGFSFEQPWWDSFDLNLGATYFNIAMEDTITELTATYVVNDCYVAQPNFVSPRCSSAIRGSDGFITNVQAGFENLGQRQVRGVDYNVQFDKDLNLIGKAFDLTLVGNATQMLEYAQQSYDAQSGVFSERQYVGTPGTPEWKALMRARITMDKAWKVTWTTNYIGGTEVDDDFKDSFSDVVEGGADTCYGPTLDDVQCRDVDFMEDYWLHSVSLYYTKDSWTAGIGVRNVFDTEPPVVDGSEILSVNNTPIGYGYDLNGRTFFANISKKF